MRRRARGLRARARRRSRSCAIAASAARRPGCPRAPPPRRLVAALLWQRNDAVAPVTPGAAAFEDLDIVAGGEDFDLLGEDADFVAWAAEQAPDGVG